MTKAFKITDGKGFQMVFANGNKVSVQFGYGSYCDHYAYMHWENLSGKDNPRLGEEGSNTAETAIIDKYGNFISHKDDDVQGYQTADQALEAMAKAAGYKLVPKPTNAQQRESSYE